MVFINPEWNFTAQDFRKRAKEASHSRTYERFLAMALLLEGKKPSDVAVLIGRHYSTILSWVDRYNENGIDSLYYKSPPGQKPWLTQDQMQNLKEAVQKSPQVSGLQGVQWTYKQIIEFCYQNFQITIKERAAQYYLKRLGFVRKRPKQHYSKASEEKKSIS